MQVTSEVLRYVDDTLAPNPLVAMEQLWRALVAIVALDAACQQSCPNYASICALHTASTALPAVRDAVGRARSYAQVMRLSQQASILSGQREIVWRSLEGRVWDHGSRTRHAATLEEVPVRHTIAELHALLLALTERVVASVAE